jgi:hypothetical protein
LKPTVRRWKDGLFLVILNDGTKAILTLEELSRLVDLANAEIMDYLTMDQARQEKQA